MDSISKEAQKDFEKIARVRNAIRRKAERMFTIMEFLEYEFEKNHLEQLDNLIIDLGFFRPDLELLIKQKDIENYKSDLYDIAYILSSTCRDVGMRKIPFIRRYKIWLLLKK